MHLLNSGWSATYIMLYGMVTNCSHSQLSYLDKENARRHTVMITASPTTLRSVLVVNGLYG